MFQSVNQQHIWAPPAGTVIRVSRGFYDHVALLSDRQIHGERGVLSFSSKSGGLVEESFSAFSAGRRVSVDGYLGSTPPARVMQRARLKHDQAYSWTEFNCEHFVRYAHGVLIESPQLQKWAALGGILSVFGLVAMRP
ncbi:lecithin retinol acyltransferase family protein [Polaromonas sp.]|uniref:lecithin retinol acyltransferase family protein n=1 Tax=Polaromonas sp. TaxID=1869339 RepID=UPI0037510B2D